ncbi:MAG: tyrosine-type recombinase/integrase [Elusimicrobia bacterium]|nr:tyrosine-type recombinase/integrase [Elusimicrobiota bacterium]
MSNQKGHPLKAVRLDRERIRLDFTHGGRRVRGEVRAEALAALILGEIDSDSNLVFGEAPITLTDFVNQVYIPFDATPRLLNVRSLKAEVDIVKPWLTKLGKMMLHEIQGKDAERCKDEWITQGLAGNTIKRRWDALGRVLDCGKTKGRIKNRILGKPSGLALANRSGIWLKLSEIDPILAECEKVHRKLRPLIEFLILTGARIGEAQLLVNGDIRNGTLWLPTEKQGCPPRDATRPLDIKSLGPRFAALLPKLKPHPVSGLYFYANDAKLTAITESYAISLFQKALAAVGRIDFTLHDCRGTFATHRAMVVNSFRQLQAELGHGNQKSITAYLARARQFDRRESIFYSPPRQRRSPGRPQIVPPGLTVNEGHVPPPPLHS